MVVWLKVVTEFCIDHILIPIASKRERLRQVVKITRLA